MLWRTCTLTHINILQTFISVYIFLFCIKIIDLENKTPCSVLIVILHVIWWKYKDIIVIVSKYCCLTRLKAPEVNYFYWLMPSGDTVWCARRQYWIVFILGSSIEQRPRHHHHHHRLPGLPVSGDGDHQDCGTLVSSMMSNIYVLLVNNQSSCLGSGLTLVFLRPLSSSLLSSVSSAKEEAATSSTTDVMVPRSLWGDNTFLSYIKYFPSWLTTNQNRTKNQSKTNSNSVQQSAN